MIRNFGGVSIENNVAILKDHSISRGTIDGTVIQSIAGQKLTQ